MQWSLLGLWTMSLYALIHTAESTPDRLSIAGVLRAFRRMMRDYQHRQTRHGGLRDLLRQALIDDYQRASKKSRNYPRKKQEKPPGAPGISLATAQQRQLASTVKKQAM